MGTNSGTTHIKTIFSFLPKIENHFIGNVLCSCDDSVTELFNILDFSTINIVLYKPQKKDFRGVKWGGGEMGRGIVSSYPTIRKLSVLKGTNI